MKENSINNWEEITIKHTNNQMQKKPNDFGPKYGNQKKKKHNKKAEWINNMTRELGLEEGPNAEIHTDLLKTTPGKHQAMMEYMVSGSRNSPPFTTD